MRLFDPLCHSVRKIEGLNGLFFFLFWTLLDESALFVYSIIVLSTPTDKNPYQKYVLFDPLGRVTKIGAGGDQDEAEPSLDLADAPKSLLEGDRVDRPELVAPYKPQLGQVIWV